MSNTSPFAEYVHEHDGRFFVAEWVDRANQYQWPLSAEARKLSGCSGGFARRVSESPWRFKARGSAMACARRLFGEKVEAYR